VGRRFAGGYICRRSVSVCGYPNLAISTVFQNSMA
jgi:hypothetical protein